MTLLLARKVKLPKCQEIPIASAGGKKTVLLLLLVDVTLKKNRKLDLQQWITKKGKAVSETFYTPNWQILFYR